MKKNVEYLRELPPVSHFIFFLVKMYLKQVKKSRYLLLAVSHIIQKSVSFYCKTLQLNDSFMINSKKGLWFILFQELSSLVHYLARCDRTCQDKKWVQNQRNAIWMHGMLPEKQCSSLHYTLCIARYLECQLWMRGVIEFVWRF